MKHQKYYAWVTIALLTISGQVFAACEAELKLAAAEAAASHPEYTYEYLLDNFQKHYTEMDSRPEELKKQLLYTETVIDACHKASLVGHTYSNCNPAGHQLELCEIKWKMELNASAANGGQHSIQKQSSQEQQSSQQQAQQQAQLAQRDAQQAQQRQARADQDRKGKRRRHEPENVATECLSVDVERPGFGGFINKCNFQVWYVFCNLNPKEGSWAEAHDCVKHYGAAGQVGANGFSAAHVKNTETVYFYACKEPAWALDDEYVPGQGIAARCHTVGGN